ncbi:MAG TPA: efflux transporter outer membrane subunit [Steroidobacteraceae bacterium]
MSAQRRGARAGVIAAALAALSVSALSGCATSGGLAPRAHLASADHLAASQTLSRAEIGQTWPAQQWWTSLGDPQLDRLIEAGLDGSPSLQVAQARMRLALAAARSARAARFPQIDVGGSSTRELYPSHSFIPPPYAGTWNTLNELSSTLNFEIDFWGKNRAAYEQALGESRAAALDAEAARIALSAAIAHTYIALERGYLERDVTRTLLEERRQIYDLTRERNTAGIDSRLEVKQAESALPDAEERLTQLDEAIDLTRNALAALVGQGPDRGRSIARPALAALPDVRLPSRLPAELLGRRPDILALRWRVESAQHGIASAKADFYPNVDLTALAGFEALGMGAFFAAANREVSAGPAVTLPIFDAGRRRANLAARDAEYDIAVEQYEQALADALRDVADQLTSLRSIAEQRSEQRDGLATAQDAYDLALLRYRDGVGNYLQVLTTHEQLLAQRELDADLRARAWDVSVDLERALGGGFVPSSAEQPPPIAAR